MVSFTERSASADPFRVWKIYCFVLAALMYVVVCAAAFRPMLLVDFAITVVSFFGLCGLAFRKRFGWRAFWRAQCFIFPLWDLVFNFGPSSNSAAAVRMEALVLMLLFVPQYWALWEYGYRSPELWGLTRSAA
jgi:hypothetical protein